MSRAKQSYVQSVGSSAPLSWKHQTAAVIPGAQSYITAAAQCSMKMLTLEGEGSGSGGMDISCCAFRLKKRHIFYSHVLHP